MALILQACFAIPLKSDASPISRQQAQQNALNFLQQRGKTIAITSLRHAPMRATMNDEPQPYYVFNIWNNQGYVIASGDDAAHTILGYSDVGFIDMNDLPCNLQAWLDGYAQQIKYLQEHHATPSRAPKKTDYPPAIEPMLTCHWSQRDPYNMYCPIDPTTGTKSLTGCVATAMAQVMYYHRARSIRQTTIEIPEYTTRTRGIHVDAIPAGTVIDWDNMVDNPNSYNTTEVQKQAVANLMKYCGTAVRMDYTSSGSGSGVYPYNLVRYFNYSPLTKYINRYSDDVTDEEWENLIYSELKNSLPVLYAISDGYGFNHQVVCDGYDGNGYYHINYGWGGSNDGFYLITRADGSMLCDLDDDFVGSWNALFNAEPLPIPPNDDQGNGIHFIDPNTRTICLWIADANGDWVLTENEAAAVTDASKLCFNNTPIISFDEFKYFTGITSIYGSTFSGCSNLKNITIPNTVTMVGGSAFANCGDLTSIDIPNSVSIIDNNAFRGCSGLASINIPSTVTTIGNYAFGSCSSLTSIEIPNSIESIGEYAFYECTNLTNATINGGNIGKNVFFGCTNLTDVTVNGGSIGLLAFYECTSLKNLTVNGGSIEQQAFQECSGLKKLTIGKSITSIGNFAFWNCSGLTDLIWNAQNCSSNGTMYTNNIERVTIGNEVTVLPNVFLKGSKITSVTIPNSVSIIGSHAFSDCSALKSISIPNSVNSLGGNLCNGCSNLKSVAIGKSVTDMGKFNFYGCDSLTSMYCLPLNPPSLYHLQFNNDWQTNIQKFNSVTLYVPLDAVNAYRSTHPWYYFGDIVGLDPSLGDVNLDHEINIADINVIINNILSDNDDCLNAFMSDVNCDGEVNIADINVLIDKILRHQ